MITISMWKDWVNEYKENLSYEDYIYSVIYLFIYLIQTPLTIIVDFLTLPIEVFAYIKSKGKIKKYY